MMMTTTTNTPRYELQFKDPGMQPKDYMNLSAGAVEAALAQETKARNFMVCFVKQNGRVVQIFERELGCDDWYAHRPQAPLAHLGKATSKTEPTRKMGEP